MFATSLVLLLLGQTPLEVIAPTEFPPRSAASSAASAGSEYLVTWADDRLDALRARAMYPYVRTDLWQARVPVDGGVVVATPLCEAKPTDRPAVAADPQTREVTIAWFEATASGVQLRRAVARPAGGSKCVPGAVYATSQSVRDLRGTWAGTRTLLAWTNVTIANTTLLWLDSAGVATAGPTPITSGAPGSASPSLGALTGAARVAWVDQSAFVRVQDVREDQTSAITGTERTLGIANGVALDQRGSVAVMQTGSSAVALALDGGAMPLSSSLSSGRLVVVAGGGRWLATADSQTQVAMQLFDRDAGSAAPLLNGEGYDALAANGAEALMVTGVSTFKDLHTRRVPMNATTLPTAAPAPLLLAPAVLRRPTVAWVGDRWLITFQEHGPGSAFEGRYLVVAPGSAPSPVHTLAATEPVVSTRPNGSLLLRTDTSSITTTWLATYDAMLDTLVLGSSVQSSPAAPAGAATDLPTAHWTATTLYSSGTPGGAPFVGGAPYRSFAAVADGLWIPVASGTTLKRLWLSDATLTAALTAVPTPQVTQAASFNAEVAPALAVGGTATDPRVLIAWADSAGVRWDTFGADGGLATPGAMPVAVPVQALAAAAAGQGFLVVWAEADAIALEGVRPDGSPTAPRRFGSPGELAGEPVAASSPSGEVVVVWPWYSPARNTVGLRFVTLDPFAGGPDAGVEDAGVADGGPPKADGGTDGGSVKDGGVDVQDGGASADAGTIAPDGGTGPVIFDTAGCACSATAAHAAWWVLVVLALRRRRSPRS